MRFFQENGAEDEGDAGHDHRIVEAGVDIAGPRAEG